MIITTEQSTRFDTDKPAKSNILMVLDDRGRKVMDTLRITGKMTTVVEFMQKVSMVEVEHSFGIDEVNENFLWQ